MHSFVKACQICQQAKPDQARYPGLLQPLPIPVGAWQVVSLDIVEGLPTSMRMNSILVVVDKFSKYRFPTTIPSFHCCFSCQVVYDSSVQTPWNAPRNDI